MQKWFINVNHVNFSIGRLVFHCIAIEWIDFDCFIRIRNIRVCIRLNQHHRNRLLLENLLICWFKICAIYVFHFCVNKCVKSMSVEDDGMWNHSSVTIDGFEYVWNRIANSDRGELGVWERFSEEEEEGIQLAFFRYEWAFEPVGRRWQIEEIFFVLVEKVRSPVREGLSEVFQFDSQRYD